MYDLCHPSYYNISKLGCTDGTKITIAFYIYIELCEVKRLWDVEYKYNSDLDIIYIEGKKSKSSVLETYIPWPALYRISLVQIENIQEALKIDRFTFVFRGGDSTSVYYRVTKGLVKPIHPDETKRVKQQEEKKHELEQEIRRNTSILHELAKSIAQGESDVIGNKNEEAENLLDEEKKLIDRIVQEKIKDTNGQEQIENTDQEKIEASKNQQKIEDTKNEEKMQDSKAEDVEMVSKIKYKEKLSESEDVEMIPSTSFLSE